MDPLTGATTFANIVALLGQFRAERASDAQVQFNEFIQWLLESNHNDLKKLLEINTNATISIKALLAQDRQEFLERVKKLDNALASYAKTIEGFSELAEAIVPSAVLSPQSLAILKQFCDSGASKMLLLYTQENIELLLLDGSGEINISETRFIEDDLARMVELELLRHEYTQRGDNIYTITRSALKFVKPAEKA